MTPWPCSVMLIAACLLAGGCVLEPPGAQAERDRLAAAGRSYEKPFEQRTLPELTQQPDWPDVLQRAVLANGELEATYMEWKASMARIAIVGEWPNSGATLGYSYLFTRQSIKSWDRNTLSVGLDPSVNLSLPFKQAQAAKVAFEDAKARAERFRAAKFDLQRRVLIAYYDWALLAEKVRIQREAVGLLKTVSDIADQRLQTGGPLPELLKAQTEYELGLNEIANLQTELSSARAGLNALMARSPDAPLVPPDHLPQARKIVGEDTRLIQAAVENNPELAALAREETARREAVELAKLGFLPEFYANLSMTGNIERNIFATITLPTTFNRILGEIDEAKAGHQQTDARLRQAGADRAAEFASALYAMRNAQRQVELFRGIILLKARQNWESSSRAYTVSKVGLADLLETQRTLLQVQLLIAEARMTREKKLAEMEALAGVDIETFEMPTTRPTSQPTSRGATSTATP